jgi:hypothetical protein
MASQERQLDTLWSRSEVRFSLTAGLRALTNFSFRPFPEAYDVVLVFDPD